MQDEHSDFVNFENTPDWVPKYDSPIDLFYVDGCLSNLDFMRDAINDETDKIIMFAINKCGIRVDPDKLQQVMAQDRARYEDAYTRGYNDCKAEYEKKLNEIWKILNS